MPPIEVVLYGDLGSGKTTLFQIITGAFNVGKVSEGQRSVLSYNEHWTPDGHILVKDLPGKKSLSHKDDHIAHQLKGLWEPNHGLVCTIKAQKRIDLIVGEITNLIGIFADVDRPHVPKDGIAFIITQCDEVKSFQNQPDRWKADARANIKELLPALDVDRQVFFTYGMDQDDGPEYQWQRAVVDQWQSPLCDFIKANACAEKVTYIPFDANSKESQQKFQDFVCATVGQGSCKAAAILDEMTTNLQEQTDMALQRLQEMGDTPDEREVLAVISHVAKVDADAKTKLAAGDLVDASDPLSSEVMLLHDYYQKAAQMMRHVREACYIKLPYDPGDPTSTDNQFRQCPHCGQVWVKVLGCAGRTSCGAREFKWDNAASLPSIRHLVWKVKETDARKGSHSSSVPAQNAKFETLLREGRYEVSKTAHGAGVGCGRDFVWGDQPRLDTSAGFLKDFLTTAANEYRISEMVKESTRDKMNRYSGMTDRVNASSGSARRRLGRNRFLAAAPRVARMDHDVVW